MADKVRAHLIIHGRVQGVFFRMETRQAAEKLGVFGWVRNKSDGTVEAVIEGPQEAVDTHIQWCRQGPPASAVTKVTITRQPYEGNFDRFDITY
ncbi:MAG: acylphosphatase [Deltaproteobacteria bacterium]|nr:acylphosphatase [Deltaproteobacteria bacterium]